MYVIFYTVSDGCSYSFETFLAILPTQEEAETALLMRIELAEKLQKERLDNEEARRKLAFEAKPNWLSASGELAAAWRDRLKELGYGWPSEIPDPNIDNYEIRPVEFGVFYE